MKAILILSTALMLFHWASAQDISLREPLEGGNTNTAAAPFLFGCTDDEEATLTLMIGSPKGIISRTVELPGATEVELTGLERISDTLIAAAGHCTGCSEPGRRSVFIALYDAELNEIETLFLDPAASQGRFLSVHMASAGDRLYLSFHDEYLGGMRHLRIYDLGLNLVWPEAHQLSLAERP